MTLETAPSPNAVPDVVPPRKARAGRPRLETAKKLRVLGICMTRAEIAAARAEARRSGKPVSQWARERLVEALTAAGELS